LSREISGGWTQDNELAALGVEVAHHHYRATLAAAGVKRGRLPAPLSLPRPQPYEGTQTRAPQSPRRPGASSPGRRHASTVAEVTAVLARAFPRG